MNQGLQLALFHNAQMAAQSGDREAVAALPELARKAMEPPRFRTGDPATSQRAGRNARQFAAGHFQLILDALEVGPGTVKDLAARTGLDHVAVARRMGELQQAGKVSLTGIERDGCREWRLA